MAELNWPRRRTLQSDCSNYTKFGGFLWTFTKFPALLGCFTQFLELLHYSPNLFKICITSKYGISWISKQCPEIISRSSKIHKNFLWSLKYHEDPDVVWSTLFDDVIYYRKSTKFHEFLRCFLNFYLSFTKFSETKEKYLKYDVKKKSQRTSPTLTSTE